MTQEEQQIHSLPFLRRTAKQILKVMGFSDRTKTFLDDCGPASGLLMPNNYKKSEHDADFIGHGRLEDGTAVRIEGQSTVSKKGMKLLQVRIVKIPNEIYENNMFNVAMDFKSKGPDTSFLDP